MNRGILDVKPLISHSLPYTEFAQAFELAADRHQSMKVQLTFA